MLDFVSATEKLGAHRETASKVAVRAYLNLGYLFAIGIILGTRWGISSIFNED